MGRTVLKPATDILMNVDWNTGILDLQVFACPKKGVGAEVVGTATVRLQDLRYLVEVLTERLQVQDYIDAAQAAPKKTRKAKKAINAA